MTQDTTFAPGTVALLGLGEAGSAIAAGLCNAGGWRTARAGAAVIGIDVALGAGTRGQSMAERAVALELPAYRDYTEALSPADLVISVVTGEDAVAAARMARPWLREGTLYADYNSITGPQTKAVARELIPAGIDFVDVAVMGSFMASGHRAPLLLSGPRAADMEAFAHSAGIPARVLSENIGDASSVKILRSILMKGIEALSVECLVAARRQGLVQHLLDNLGDVDELGFAGFVRMLTITHLTHARRRMEEVEKAMQNLNETGVPALVSDAVRRSHLRTVNADLVNADLVNADLVNADLVNADLSVGDATHMDLDTALAILDEKVIGKPGPG